MSAVTLWEEGHEPGRELVALGAAVTLTVVALDLAIGDNLSWFFDLSFVILCVALALLVRPDDFFTVGVLPPLMMLGIVTLLAIVMPAAITDATSSTIGTVIAGLAHHAGALVVGYLLCLAILANRQRVLAR